METNRYDVANITDTRTFSRNDKGRWTADAGSGEHRPCDCCGADHVVHVTVREYRPMTSDEAARTPFMAHLGTPTGRVMVVGRDCAERLTGSRIGKDSWERAQVRARATRRAA